MIKNYKSEFPPSNHHQPTIPQPHNSRVIISNRLGLTLCSRVVSEYGGGQRSKGLVLNIKYCQITKKSQRGETV